MSVKRKLLTLLCGILAGFFLVFAVDVLEGRRTEHTLELERLAVSAQMEALSMRRQEKNYFLRHDPASQAAVHRHQQAAVRAITALCTLDPEHHSQGEAILGQLRAYLTGFEAIIARNSKEDAASPRAAFVTAARTLEPMTEMLRAHYEKRRRHIAATAMVAEITIQTIVIALAALAAWAIFRSVSVPLETLGRYARQVARGEATDLDPAAFSGEFRGLAEDLVRMEKHLGSTILDLGRKEREAAEEARQAQEARQHAEALSRVKSNFLGLVSHELKTPLTSMVGFAQVMLKRLERGQFAALAAGKPDVAAECDRFRDNLEIMLAEGHRLTGLIDNVLELAALESGGAPLVMHAVSVTDILDQAVAPFLETMTQKGLRFVCDLPEDLPPLWCDRDRLIYVLRHLFSNAVKFTEAGQIACRARQEGQMAVICVEDTGHGIPPDMQEAVFEKFLQLGDQITGKLPGLGIGLAASRAVIECHGGSITLVGEPGQGVTVSFSVPLAEAA